MIDKEDVRRNLARMQTQRSGFDGPMQEIATLTWPEKAQFFGQSRAGWSGGTNYSPTQLHDPYALLALDDGVLLFEGFVVPRGKRWQKLALADELMANVRIAQWVEQVETRLFKLRMDPESGFVGAIDTSSKSLFAFGAQSMWVEKRYNPVSGRPIGLSYQSEDVSEIYVEFDGDGNVLRIYRVMAMTAEAAVLKFGSDLPQKVTDEAKKNGTKEFEFTHVIERNPALDPRRMDAKGMPWIACYYAASGVDECFRHGGYRSLPRVFSAWKRSGRAAWGYSPMMKVLPSIRLLQEIKRDRVFGAELRLIPPLIAAGDELDGMIVEMRGGGVTYGGMDDRGNPRLREFLTSADASDARELVMEARGEIDKAVGRDLLQINRELKTHITALRTSEELAEKGMLLGPLAQQEGAWLSPMTMRELALMDEMGLLSDAPGEVIEYFQAEGGIEWKYDNELSRFMLAQDTSAFLSLGEQIGSLTQFDPEWATQFRREYPPERVLPLLGRNAGVPASMRATDEEKAAFDAQQQAKQQLDELLAAVPALAGAAKNAAQAGQLALPAPAA